MKNKKLFQRDKHHSYQYHGPIPPPLVVLAKGSRENWYPHIHNHRSPKFVDQSDQGTHHWNAIVVLLLSEIIIPTIFSWTNSEHWKTEVRHTTVSSAPAGKIMMPRSNHIWIASTSPSCISSTGLSYWPTTPYTSCIPHHPWRSKHTAYGPLWPDEE